MNKVCVCGCTESENRQKCNAWVLYLNKWLSITENGH